MRLIKIVGSNIYNDTYANWMEGRQIMEMALADLVVFTGGEDVSPALYSQKTHPRTHFNVDRDMDELKAFNDAVKRKLPIVGICRGAQFCCVMAGGELVQHQENPTFIHPIETIDGDSYLVSSTHHQAQYPWMLDDSMYKVLAWSQGVSKFHEDGDEHEMVNGVVDDEKEVEIVYYPGINALAIQPHPEMLYPHRQTNLKIMSAIGYFQQLLTQLMNGRL